MSVRYSRGRSAVGKKPHQRRSSRPRQTDEVVLRALQHGKPRQPAETSRSSGAQNTHEFRDFLKAALANAPADRRTQPLFAYELRELYGDTSHIRPY